MRITSPIRNKCHRNNTKTPVCAPKFTSEREPLGARGRVEPSFVASGTARYLRSRAGCRPEGQASGSPASLGVALPGGQVGEGDTDHGLTQAARDLGDDVGVVVEGGGLHD